MQMQQPQQQRAFGRAWLRSAQRRRQARRARGRPRQTACQAREPHPTPPHPTSCRSTTDSASATTHPARSRLHGQAGRRRTVVQAHAYVHGQVHGWVQQSPQPTGHAVASPEVILGRHAALAAERSRAQRVETDDKSPSLDPARHTRRLLNACIMHPSLSRYHVVGWTRPHCLSIFFFKDREGDGRSGFAGFFGRGLGGL